MSDRLSVGDPAPTFTLLDQAGRPVELSGLAGRRVLIYFYPKADTPGCTTQACGLRDVLGDVGDTGILGISPDAPAKQARFDQKYGLGFPLLADEDHSVAEAYGVWVQKSMYGRTYMGIERSAHHHHQEEPVSDPMEGPCLRQHAVRGQPQCHAAGRLCGE